MMDSQEQNNKDKKEDLKHVKEKHEGDPQEDMEGLVSSILQRGKEIIDKTGERKGHIEHPHKDDEK